MAGSPARRWASPSRTMSSARSASGTCRARRVGDGLLVPGGGLGRREVLGGVVGGGHRPPLGGGEVTGEGRVAGQVDDGVR